MILGTKSGEKKSYGPKWESCENVGTKISFIPKKKKSHISLEWDMSRSKQVGDTLSFLMKWLDINEVKIMKKEKDNCESSKR